MKQNDKYLTESLDILKRDFGQPLPTLQDTTKAHQAKKLQENPGAAAGAAMATIMLMNPQTGRKNKATTALRNKDNPSHKKAVGMFQKLKDKRIPLDAKILVIGAGSTNSTFLRRLKKYGYSNFTIFNRTMQ